MPRIVTTLCLLLMIGCERPAAPPAGAAVLPTLPSTPPPRPYLLHLPGVSGESFVDHTLVAGFRRGNLDADIEIYDWTEHDPGIPALQATGRNKKQAQMIADQLTTRFRADPRLTIDLTSHSGGAGLAAWAMEDLPPDVKIQTVIFLAPALSPGYDLSRALGHVRGKAYVFFSDRDTLVLSAGTKVFGTIDGVYSEAAGYVGFKAPPESDRNQYAKLVQYPYDPAWARFGHFGDHIGPMDSAFSQAILVPLLESKSPATRPVQP